MEFSPLRSENNLTIYFMSIENGSESRESSTLREEAEQRLRQDNELRSRELKKVLNNLDEQKITEQQILDYLNGREPEVLEPELLKSGEFGSVLEMVCRDEKIFSIPDSLTWKYGKGEQLFKAVIQSPTGVGLDTDLFRKVGYYPVFWENEIAMLKMVALLYRHFQTQEPREIIAQRLPFHTAEYLRLGEHDIPPWLLLRLPQDYRDELEREQAKIDQMIGKHGLDTIEGIEKFVDKHRGPGAFKKAGEMASEKVVKEKAEERAKGIESTGMHPKMYDRREDVAFEQRMSALEGRPGTEEVFKRIFEVYPDIRVLVDKILGLKDGKLPI